VTFICCWLFSLQQKTLGLKLSPLTTRLPRCIIKPAQLETIPSSLIGDCSSFEVLIQFNWIESRVITGIALPLPLQLGPAILWFKILSNKATEQLYQLCPYNYYYHDIGIEIELV
jgi:hypothetical protein